MLKTNHNLSPEEFAKSILEKRSFIAEQLEQARAKGNRGKIRSWESMFRKAEKLISEYGLERYT